MQATVTVTRKAAVQTEGHDVTVGGMAEALQQLLAGGVPLDARLVIKQAARGDEVRTINATWEGDRS